MTVYYVIYTRKFFLNLNYKLIKMSVLNKTHSKTLSGCCP